MVPSTLLSIHVATPEPHTWNGRTYHTAIFKKSVHGPVQVRALGIDGDKQGDLSVHGGHDKAVYAYGLDAYQEWKTKTGRVYHAGDFGENLVLSTLNENQICIGDIFSLGDCELQVSEPRFPCSTLAMKFKDLGLVKLFTEVNRPGIYFRVLKEGQIKVGDTFTPLKKDPSQIPFMEMVEYKLTTPKDRRLADRLLSVASLCKNWREKIQKEFNL